MSKHLPNTSDERSKVAGEMMNPFPGLRPFTISESHLFFGREGQTDEVLLKLSANRFVAIIGPSGSGKSSFVYCGVVPILYGGFLENLNTDWHIVVARPGANPIENLAEAMLSADKAYIQAEPADKHVKKTIMSTLLRSSSLGLVEAVAQQRKSSAHHNYLILVDQFEELFRFKQSEEDLYHSINESLAYVNLLMAAVDSIEVPTYIAVTMRSDYLGDCAQFPNLTEKINQSYYLIPQMTREQKRMAITGPVAVGGGQISQRLVQQLLNDLGDNPDQLPILQHALMRTWDYWMQTRERGEPIDIQHYEAIGQMSEALSIHANEAFDELTESQKLICESMFKTLTEKGNNAHGIRRPALLSEIAAIADVSEAQVIEVIDKFRQPGRALLMPAHTVALDSDSIIDFSHESLMRIWVRLRKWVDEEAEAVQMYLRLCEAAAKYQIGQAGLWRPPDLQLALNWQTKQKPTLVWGQRYEPAFERAMVFLETSKKAYETEQRAKEILQKKALRRARFIALILGLAAIVSIGFLVFAITQQIAAKEQAELARQNEQNAKVQTALAVASEREARSQRTNAEREREQAMRQEQIAQKNAQIAQLERTNAEKSALEAKKQQHIALSEREKAELNERTAVEQRSIAVKERNNAYNLRLLSIAQAMAVKSLQVIDQDLKGIIARQAYMFNQDNKGKEDDPYIYDGLYYAMKRLKEESFNYLRGHSDNVRALISSATGAYVYSAGSDGKILRWNPAKPDEGYTTLGQISGTINRTLALSSDDRWLACGSEDSYIRLYDLTQPQKKVQLIRVPVNQVWSLAYTFDNSGLVFADSSSVFYHDFNRAYLLHTAFAKINALVTNPRKNMLVIGDQQGQIFVWSVIGGGMAVLFKNPSQTPITALSFSNDGKWLTAGDEKGVVRVWNIEKREQVATLIGHTARINNIKFNWSDTKLATGSWDKTVRLWNTAHWEDQPIVLKDHDDWVWSIAFSTDGEKLLAGCKDRMVRVWPTNARLIADIICDKIKRNMSRKEWDLFVGDDIPYESTCSGIPAGDEIQTKSN